MTFVLLAGAAAGLVHVLTGPDHLAAIAPLAAGRPRGAWRAGVRWGLGHSGGVLVMAAAAVVLRELVVPDAVSAGAERLVGAGMVGVGLWGLRRALLPGIHVHLHGHGARRHLHLHVHAPDTAHAEPRAHAHRHAAFGMGLLHGAAGGAHVLGVLPALALPAGAAAAWLAGFAGGSVAAMGLFAHGMGLAAGHAAARGERAWRGLLGTAAAGSAAMGVVWLARG